MCSCGGCYHGPVKGESELTKGQVKKGLKRGHGQGRSSANREDLCLSSPVQVSASATSAISQNPEGKGRPGAAVLRTSLGVHRAGGEQKKRRGRESQAHQRCLNPWGRVCLSTTLIVRYCVPDLCLLQLEKVKLSERTSWLE